MSYGSMKSYLFVSDFDQTLTFNDSGYVLSEIVGIGTQEFERKAKGMAKINLVQQGAELAYLLLHDPEFRSRVRKEHLVEVGKQIRLKSDIKLLYEILDHGIEGYHFDFYVLSAAPVEVIYSALDGPHQRLKPILKQAFFAAVNAAPPKKRFRWTGHRTLVCRGGNSFRGWW